jgi:DNA mismatch repair protein MSH3
MPPSSQAKKQASISSFFTPKPSATHGTFAAGHPTAEDNDDDNEELYGHSRLSTLIKGKQWSRGVKRVTDDTDSDVENIAPSPKRAKSFEEVNDDIATVHKSHVQSTVSNSSCL